MINLDIAGMYALDERLESVETQDYHAQAAHLRQKGEALALAQAEGIRLLMLFERSDKLRLIIRALNKFVTAIMEGKMRRGTNGFGDFLVNLMREVSPAEPDYAEVLEFYIALSCADPETPRAIPFEIAETAGLYPQDVNALRPKLEVKLRWENLIKDMEVIIYADPHLESLSLPDISPGRVGAIGKPKSDTKTELMTSPIEKREREKEKIKKRNEVISIHLRYSGVHWSTYALTVDYMLMQMFPRIQDILRPYCAARFSREEDDNKWWNRTEIPNAVAVNRQVVGSDLSWLKTTTLPKEYILEGLPQFLSRYKEGAWVTLSILALARGSYEWISDWKPSSAEWRRNTAEWPHLPLRPDILGISHVTVEKAAYDIIKTVLAIRPVLTARVPNESERKTLRRVCKEKLWEGGQGGIAATIDEFARFCDQLAKPENHVRVRCGQYIEKQVPTRQESDMVNEMARVLTSLPRYTAYARVVEEKNGEASVWKGKVEKLARAPDDALEKARKAVEENVRDYSRPREEIRAEIGKRQEKWRKPRVRVEAPSSAEMSEGQKAALASERAPVAEGEEPPPPRRVLTGGSGEVESKARETGKASVKERLVYKSDFTKPTGWDEEHSEAVKVFRLDGY
jgi:hypothetical protein